MLCWRCEGAEVSGGRGIVHLVTLPEPCDECGRGVVLLVSRDESGVVSLCDRDESREYGGLDVLA